MFPHSSFYVLFFHKFSTHHQALTMDVPLIMDVPLTMDVPTQPNPETPQILSSILPQSSLCYSEDTKCLICDHLFSLLTNYPTLKPGTNTMIYKISRRSAFDIVQADGTIPMTYKAVTYHTPIVILLLESYPRHPPLVYLNPPPYLKIKHHHPYVSSSGLVTVPYLQNWIYPTSNLVDLALDLSLTFGREPPLFSNPNPNPNPTRGCIIM